MFRPLEKYRFLFKVNVCLQKQCVLSDWPAHRYIFQITKRGLGRFCRNDQCKVLIQDGNENIRTLHYFGVGILLWPIYSLHKWPVIQKASPCRDAIMFRLLITCYTRAFKLFSIHFCNRAFSGCQLRRHNSLQYILIKVLFWILIKISLKFAPKIALMMALFIDAYMRQ